MTPPLDLNLLVAFDALLSEGGVTRAAARLGLSQSGTSRALARLRATFGDDLFVRTPTGLRPTRRALELAVPLRRALGELRALASRETAFDPRRAERRFRIAANDYAQLAVVAPLAARLAAAAPGLRLEVVPLSSEAERDLDTGALDLLLAPRLPSAPGVVWTPLFEDGYTCVVWKEHPLRALTLARYAALDHVLVAPRNRPGGIVDEALAARGRARRVALQVPTFLIVPHMLVGTDRISTVPVRVARTLVRHHPLRELRPPLPIPRFTMAQGWHELHREDPGHRWLRARAAEVVPP
jgi:DNA-binding transcriptional LysR family regulator